MWTVVTIVYLAAGGILSARLLLAAGVLPSLLAFATLAGYLCIYTPLNRITPLAGQSCESALRHPANASAARPSVARERAAGACRGIERVLFVLQRSGPAARRLLMASIICLPALLLLLTLFA
jgi:hypothetical protein